MVLIVTIALGCSVLYIVSLLMSKIYMKFTSGICRSDADLTGKTVIITGANTGIGYYTALDLAKRNARVILACRSKDRGQAAVDRIRTLTGNNNVHLRLVDMSLMKSVRHFAEDIIKEESRINVLINNAGISCVPKMRVTEEGFEETFACNYFGPFLLTNLLLEKLKQSSPSRIINVSSLTHRWTTGIDFDNLKAEKSYKMFDVYNVAKLGNVLFTRELARRLQGTDVCVYAVHPGRVRTELLRYMPIVSKPILILNTLFFKTPEEGAQTLIHCAVSDEVKGQSGKYYVDCREADDQSSEMSKDMGLAKKLWKVSEKITAPFCDIVDKNDVGTGS